MNSLKLMFLLFLISFFSFGCMPKAKSPPVRLYLSFIDEVPSDFKDKLLYAIDELNAEAGTAIVALSPVENGKPLSILSTRSNSLFAHAQYLDYHCKIEIDDSNSTVNSQDPNQIDLKYIILHEIGHCYGYQHTKDTSSIMYPDYSGVYPCSLPSNVCTNIENSAKNKIHSFLLVLKTLF